MYNFNASLAETFAFDNWPTKNTSKRKADAIEHQSDRDRSLVDSIMYSETLTALLRSTIKINKKAGEGSHLHCLGHTHNPQAQPYLDIVDLIPLPFIKSFKNKIDKTAPFNITEEMTLIKTNFFNAGVSGWIDGIVWAIDIGEHGGNTDQANLIFWDKDNNDSRLQTMDWQLPYKEDELRIEINKLPVAKIMSFISDLPDILKDSILGNTAVS